MNALNRHNVHVFGPSHKQAIVFAHGFGCDQNMWRYVAPQFVHDHQVVLFDHIGAGGSTLANIPRLVTAPLMRMLTMSSLLSLT